MAPNSFPEKKIDKKIFEWTMKGLLYPDARELIEKEIMPVDRKELSKIMEMHLKLEFIMDTCIKESIPLAADFDTARLSFFQKIHFFPIRDEEDKKIIPCLKEFNSLRNKYVHNLKFVAGPVDIKEITTFLVGMDVFNGETIPSLLEVIEIFCTYVEMRLLIESDYYAGFVKKIIDRNKRK